MLRLVAALVTLVCIGLGLRQTQAQFWACDDAFISFRYAENFVAGRGLVFNTGEWVEGYTNYSWTMLCALGMELGIEPVTFCNWLGFGCFAATLALLLFASRRIAGNTPWLPIAAAALALHPHAQLFATCGLETPLFVLLVTLLLLLTAWANHSATFALAGLVGTLAAMTRPDGLLLCAISGSYALLRAARGQLAWRKVVAMALPGVLIYVPYFVWKWSYYGHPLPNTFYAKTAHDPYVSQGLLYLRLFFTCYWVLIPALLALLVAAVRRPRAAELRPDPLAGLTLAYVLGYLAFVAWVGGDFMFGRFVMPITPALYLGFELLRRSYPGAGPALLLGALAIAGTELRLFPEQLRNKGDINGIVEEPTYYPAQEVAHKRRCAELLRGLYGQYESRIAIGGAQAMIAFYGKFDQVIECSTGLTDEYLAHLPIGDRTRIGHEKSIERDPDYLLRRRVQFQLDTRPRSEVPGIEPHRLIVFGPEWPEGQCWGRIVTYDRALMRHLRTQPGVQFVDVEAYLDSTVLPGLAAMPTAEVEKLWRELQRFYFNYNDDKPREDAFRARLGLPAK